MSRPRSEALQRLACCSGLADRLEALERFGELYRIECEIKGRSAEERNRARQTHAAPRLQALHTWLNRILLKVPKSSELAKAIRYTIKEGSLACAHVLLQGRPRGDR